MLADNIQTNKKAKNMNRLIEIINNLNLEELENLKKDIDSGNLQKLINQRILTLKHKKGTGICPVCHTGINENAQFTLFFGPKEFKQKASFCGQDCLEYFLYRIKKTKQGQPLGFENKNIEIREE